jgi:predicted  nucleic acid-binding Zn-ribbon protein
MFLCRFEKTELESKLAKALEACESTRKHYGQLEQRANRLQRDLDRLQWENQSVLKEKDDLNVSVVKLRDELEASMPLILRSSCS